MDSQIKQDNNNSLEITTNPDSDNRKVNLALLNGSQKIGVTNDIEDKLVNYFNDSNINVVYKDFADYREYKNTLVVVMNSGFEDIAKQIAQLLSADLTTTMPEFESASISADIAIIVGAQ
ncbi:MAG: hypothetical protein KatS3mg091_335 [Patescibacteria group bacterium]|nr:MAG: hypothetical protein KatS3mg091_335 [Patescibacteria group bacterium]